MSVAELRTQIQEAITQLANVRAVINSAATHIDEARSIGQFTFQGSTQSEATQHETAHTEALDTLSSATDLLDRVTQDLAQYIKRLGPSDVSTDAAIRPTPEPTKLTDAGPVAVPKESVERIRAELPSPVVPGTGAKTHGRLITGGKELPVTSGADSMSAKVEAELKKMGIPASPVRATDVEMKTAAWQRTSGTQHATVVINHVPCTGDWSCDTLVPVLLPEGYTLTVHGQNKNGVKFRKRYTGGAAPWWH
ncbi:DddA-like double-stranded DNA deaminase toxin [Actinosynnema sp. ALI-1.44]|uniref:DddA-like double-stranded DNA deaminase toxin n=1 Tax=Actinosynnema sp. ALI-1.44 TaxID=1933779 RepID=UPI001EDA51C1|nr:DddA-like double-stranded DNA deaminase toxin [Actinosynnema sp. ALI-1.44]